MSFRESLTEEEFDAAEEGIIQPLTGQTKAALLGEARRRFPKGSLFLQFDFSDPTVSTGIFNWCKDRDHGNCIAMNDEDEVYVWTEKEDYFLDGNWAKVYEDEVWEMPVEGYKDMVDHPSHYGGEDNPYEAIKVIEAWDLGFNLGNTVKYISRAGKKDSIIQELQKAKWYLEREINNLKK